MKIAVIGAGVMGPGIAQVFLMGGHQVYLNDISQDALEKARMMIRGTLDQMAAKDVIDENATRCLDNLMLSVNLEEAVKDAAIVIEAVPEQIEIKQALYQELDKYCAEDAVIASNTSALPLPEIFPDFHSGKFFVAHFFNPPSILPLVELVKNDKAEPEKVELLKGTLEECGKTVVVVNQFVKGFLINRLQTALSREALYLLDHGIVSAEDLDKAARASIGFKSVWQGFFDTMDYIGLDTVSFVYDIIYPELCNDEKTPEVIHDMVKQGKLGTKSGEGFYKYTAESLAQTNEKRIDMLLEQLKLWNKYEA